MPLGWNNPADPQSATYGALHETTYRLEPTRGGKTAVVCAGPDGYRWTAYVNTATLTDDPETFRALLASTAEPFVEVARAANVMARWRIVTANMDTTRWRHIGDPSLPSVAKWRQTRRIYLETMRRLRTSWGFRWLPGAQVAA